MSSSSQSALDCLTRLSSTLATLDERPFITLSHFRTLPMTLSTTFTIVRSAASHIHATSTKYALLSSQAGSASHEPLESLAQELCQGAEQLTMAALALFDAESGASRSLRRYVKQYSRAVIAALVSLVSLPPSSSSLAPKAGVVWSACDAITHQLPRGNRSAMRRELMVWIRDCTESIAEFQENMQSGERHEQDQETEEMYYTAKEKIVVQSSINLMKCTKNVLGLVIKACDCVGESIEKQAVLSAPKITTNAVATEMTTTDTCDLLEKMQLSSNNLHAATTMTTTVVASTPEMLQWISDIHDCARTIGEGVTDFGILLYPPLELLSSQTILESATMPSLSPSNLSQQLRQQLQAMERCIHFIYDGSLSEPRGSIQSCLSQEVLDTCEALKNAILIRTAEIERAMQSEFQIDH